jgi:hypothetical protein
MSFTHGDALRTDMIRRILSLNDIGTHYGEPQGSFLRDNSSIDMVSTWKSTEGEWKYTTRITVEVTKEPM